MTDRIGTERNRQAIAKASFLTTNARRLLEDYADQIEREIRIADGDSSTACLSLQMTMLQAREHLTAGLCKAMEAVA